MKITTALLAEPPFNNDAATTTATPTSTRTNPARKSVKIHLGNPEFSSPFPSSSTEASDKKGYLNRK
jgi:hypothetical protein